MTRFRPRSLAGQLALLVAAALFVAQAINFGLLVAERRDRRINQNIIPAVVRVVDAVERYERRGVIPTPRRRPRNRMRRVEFMASSGVTAAMARQAAVEERVRGALAEAGSTVLEVRAAEVSRAQSGLGQRPLHVRPRNASARVLVISVRLEADMWLTLRTAVPGGEAALIWRLALQTAVLYLALLIAVLWIGRRAARPLGELADAAAAFGTGGSSDPLVERGPADIRALTAAFNAMRTRLAATMDEKDRMLGAIGHDLRTPLASLRLRAESVEDEQERARMIATITEMSGTLDDILSLAQAGRSRELATRVDLSALVDAVVEDLRDLGGDLDFEPSPRLALDLRPVLTRRAVRNLLENALKYGSRAIVRVRSDRAYAIVEIDDEGPGVPEDAHDHVFESFARLETSRNRETGGAGLGLALARAIVREQGGEIRLENRRTGGLRASLLLPIA